MRIRNDESGYGVVTKFLHWLTVAAVLAQFVLGYAMEGLAERFVSDDSDSDEALVFVHAGLGVAILCIAVLRLAWRSATPLPPWSERLGPADRRVAHVTERVLYVLLFAVPLSGLALLFLSGEERDTGREWQPPYELIGGDFLLGAHVACHLVFYATLLVHVGLAVRRGTLGRMI